MKKIIRTRTITKTSRRLVVCHENLAAGESGEHAPAICPNCGEPILPPVKALQLPAQIADRPELHNTLLEKEEKQEEGN